MDGYAAMKNMQNMHPQAQSGTSVPMRPGGMSDSKTNLVARIQSLGEAVDALSNVLDAAGVLRAGGIKTPGHTSPKDTPPSMDSALSQHLSDLGLRVSGIGQQVEELTQRIDV